MKIAILGYGSQSIAALKYWGTSDNHISIHDSRTDIALPDQYEAVLGPNYLKELGGYDLIVRGAPTVHPRDIVEANPDYPQILDKITSVTNEFFNVCPSKNIIGVTGTKGKGTTSTLITEILRASGKTVHLGGNIGIPPLDMLEAGIKPDDWVVLELANFQLIDLKYSPKIATCLMVVPEHLNWHTDMDEYVAAKQQLFAHQTEHDLAVFNRANGHSKEVASISPASKVSYEVPSLGAEPHQISGAYLKDTTIFMNDTPVCHTDDIALLGRHNIENVCAAIATIWELVDHDTDLITKVVREFKGLSHRLEFVREVAGAKYYDDSFGTTPETAMVAVQAFEGPKIIILGGASKDAEFDDLAQVVASHNVRAVVTVGDTASQIEADLKTAGYEHIFPGGETMPEIVAAARAQAQPGDTVLLSTGCASFGLFKDYKDRGEQFKQAVQAL